MTPPAFPADLIPATEEEAEAIALEEHPLAANSSRTIDVADERQRIAASGYYPSVDLVGEYNFEQDDDGVLGSRRDWTVKVQANWELFSGLATRAETAEAAFRYKATLDNHVFVNRKIVEDVRLAWDQLDTAKKRVDLLRNAVNIAIEVHDLRKKLREAGKETVINVLDAENEVFNAQIDLTDAEFDSRIAEYRLLLAMGRMTPATLGLGDPTTTSSGSGAKVASTTSPKATSASPTTKFSPVLATTTSATKPITTIPKAPAQTTSVAPAMVGKSSQPEKVVSPEPAVELPSASVAIEKPTTPPTVPAQIQKKAEVPPAQTEAVVSKAPPSTNQVQEPTLSVKSNHAATVSSSETASAVPAQGSELPDEIQSVSEGQPSVVLTSAPARDDDEAGPNFQRF